MVIDTSALIAMLFAEPERDLFSGVIASHPLRLLSAMTKLETGMVAVGRLGDEGGRGLDILLHELEITVIPFDEHQADIARDAFARFGKGRHPANLNFGDCAAYALAVAEAEPLLFKGTDFQLTDIATVEVPG